MYAFCENVPEPNLGHPAITNQINIENKLRKHLTILNTEEEEIDTTL